jgi:threonine synthase
LGSEERCTDLPADFATVAEFVVDHARAAASLTGAEA